MAKHVRMNNVNNVNNMNSENCDGRESGTDKNSWIQIAAGQTVSRRQNYLHVHKQITISNNFTSM